MHDPTSKQFWILWAVGFLGFPAAGVTARLVGPVMTPTRALLAGAVWSVFGSVGAWPFQPLTGLTLYVLLRSPSGIK